MTQDPQTSSVKNPVTVEFQDKMVDNKGFFDTMEEKLSPLLSTEEITANTRLELHKLLAEMKKKTFIHGVTEWTAEEQKKFLARVQSEMFRVGTSFRAVIQELIEDEILREINDNGLKMKLKKYGSMKLLDGNGNIMLSDINAYPNFLEQSFITQETTSIIPFDLNLTVSETDSIDDAKRKLDRYHGRYNALVLIDKDNRPKGMIYAEALDEYKGKWYTSVGDMPRIPETVSGNYNTSTDMIKTAMTEHAINIFPIIDTTSGVLIGIVTSKSVAEKDLKYHSTKDLTKLQLQMARPEKKTLHP